MDEDEAAKLYDDLSRKGLGAARFKQGLGYGSATTEQLDQTSEQEKRSESISRVRQKLEKSKDRSPARHSSRDAGARWGGRSRERSRSRSRERKPSASRRRSSSSSPRRSHGRRTGHASSRSPTPERRRLERSGHRSSRDDRRSPSRRENSYRPAGSSRNTREERGEYERRPKNTERRHSSRSTARDRSWSRSPARGRSGGTSSRRGFATAAPSSSKGEEIRDFSKLIPGYASMGPGERLKAQTKLLLSETMVKDRKSGLDNEWERFDFDRNAPLDDDAQQDYFGDVAGARDDMADLRSSGSTFASAAAQARHEASKNAAHEAAIFGAPAASSLPKQSRERRAEVSRPATLHQADDSDVDDEQPVVVMEDELKGRREDAQEPEKEATAPQVAAMLTQQVLQMQKGNTWQERAMKLKQARTVAAKAAPS